MKLPSFHGETIWIIGASTGMGAELARVLSKAGAKLILSARNYLALQELNQSLGGNHLILPVDVSNNDAMQESAKQIYTTTPTIHRMIFMAAVYEPSKITDINQLSAEKTVAINLMGAFHAINAVLDKMLQQQKGQIVLCGSVAGYTGLPKGQPYSATKAAIANIAETLYAEVNDKGIDVKLISPGFVRTPLTDKNEFDMPMIIDADTAAINIVAGLKKRAFEIHFPKRFTILLKLLRALPYSMTLWITRRL